MDGFRHIWRRNPLHGQSSLSHLGTKLVAECQFYYFQTKELAREQASMLNK